MKRQSFARLFFTMLFAVALVTACDDSTGPDDDDDNGGDPTENTAPVANAGADLTAEVGEEVTLDGSGSSDDDGDQLTYSWSLSTPDGSQEAVLNSPDLAEPSFTPDVVGEYTATLTVSDGNGGQDSDDVTVTVVQSADPVVINSDITSDRTLQNRFSDPSQADYLVEGGVGVENSSKLTIEKGVRIEFGAGAALSVNDNASSLVAIGTSSEPIVMTGTQEQSGFWGGVGFYSNNIQNEMAHVEIAYGGGGTWSISGTDRGGNLVLEGGSRLSLSNSTLRNSGSYGFYGNGALDLSGFASNTFENNANAPVVIPATTAGYIDGASSFANNEEAYVGVYAQDIGDDLTLSKLADGVPYRFNGTTDVEEGAQLTIEAGVNMVFESEAGLRVNGNASSLVASGTASEPIVLTGAQEQPGFWRGLGIFSNNVQNAMSHVEIYYGGGNDYNLSGTDVPANIALDRGARLSLSNSILSNSANYGLYAKSGTDISGFASNTFENNAEAPVYIPATEVGEIDGASSFANNDEAYVRVFSQNITDDATLTNLSDAPYQFTGTTDVEDGAQLTIEAGVNMVFESGAGLSVEDNASSLVATGTSSEPIVMTGTQEQSGFWRGIAFFSNNQQNRMTHVEIAYGGGDAYNLTGSNVPANIALNNGAHLELTNSVVRDSNGWGVYLKSDATLDESGNSYSSNADGDVNN